MKPFGDERVDEPREARPVEPLEGLFAHEVVGAPMHGDEDARIAGHLGRGDRRAMDTGSISSTAASSLLRVAVDVQAAASQAAEEVRHHIEGWDGRGRPAVGIAERSHLPDVGAEGRIVRVGGVSQLQPAIRAPRVWAGRPGYFPLSQ